MALPMTRPTKHPKSGVYRIRMRVPKDVCPVIGTAERIETLNTKDPKEAAERAPAAIAKIKAEFAAARLSLAPGRPLTLREIIALCGTWYRAEVAEWEDDPGDPEWWDHADDALLNKLRSDPETGEPLDFDPGPADHTEARMFLAQQGVAADADSLRRFTVELWHTKRKAAATLQKRAAGDYSADPVAASFPQEPTQPKATRDDPPLKAETLLQMWAAERQPSEATMKAYAIKFRHLSRILGFNDLRRVTGEDVVRFKQARLTEVKPATVADDVLNMGAVCNWAVRDHYLQRNPFAGKAPKALRRGPAPVAPYSEDEAQALLMAARKETGWLRWAPWVLCFTGARVSEIAEMRRRDVRAEAGVWFFDIVPTEDREGKNDKHTQRMIPLHPALVAEGFLAYWSTLPDNPDGPLFPSIRPDPRGRRATPAQQETSDWVRNVVGIKDDRKAPNHSWRHRMEDELRKVRALPEVMDAITGRHNQRNAGAGYGMGFRGMPAEVLKELERIPSPVPPLRSEAAGNQREAA